LAVVVASGFVVVLGVGFVSWPLPGVSGAGGSVGSAFSVCFREGGFYGG
jgi:hypothetical protein